MPMTTRWNDYRLQWRCACGLEWHSPIRSGRFRFHCPECGQEIFEIEAGEPGDCRIHLKQSGAVATVERLEETKA